MTTESLIDSAGRLAERLTDDELRRAAESIRGNPKRGSRKPLTAGEAIALTAVMREQERRANA